jgi:hypothetical protein
VRQKAKAEIQGEEVRPPPRRFEVIRRFALIFTIALIILAAAPTMLDPADLKPPSKGCVKKPKKPKAKKNSLRHGAAK